MGTIGYEKYYYVYKFTYTSKSGLKEIVHFLSKNIKSALRESHRYRLYEPTTIELIMQGEFLNIKKEEYI